jgi:hypothetical protein
MEYINSQEVIHLVQGVQRRTIHQNTQLWVCFQKITQRKSDRKMLHKNTHTKQPMPLPFVITESESRHFGFSQEKYISLMLSASWSKSPLFLLKILLFPSFQITQTLASQITVRKECVDLGNPAKWPNWWRWVVTDVGTQNEMSSHL